MDKLKYYKDMKYIRMVEEEIIREYHHNEIRCPIHLSIGQEAVAVGVSAYLNTNDNLISNHRCHAHYLAKGGNLKKMISELYGKYDGCCGGRGGSMHLFDEDVSIRSSIPIVGSGIPLAVGYALSDKINKSTNLTVVFFGDGAIEEGVFHECANFASLNNLPILFICENNLYSCYTHLSKRQANRNITKLPGSHNIKNIEADGNNILEVLKTANKMIDYIKNNKKPGFILFNTYRHLEHCGISSDDNLNYRENQEIEKWFENDPLRIFEKHLVDDGIINDTKIQNIQNNISVEIKNAFDFAKQAEFPSPLTINNYIYK